MSEQSKGNYNALMWVQEELQKSLSLGLSAIQQYIDDPQDTIALSNCVEQLYQTNGTLEMLNLQGAQRLTAEMQAVVTQLRTPQNIDAEAALDALVRGLLLLPGYLKLINEQTPDHPLCLLTTINELRSLRGQPTLEPEALLDTVADAPLPDALLTTVANLPTIDIESHQLSHAFQHQLLKWFRQAEDSRLRKLRGILRYLRLSSSLQKTRLLWWVAEALVEGILHRGVPINAELKQLLGKLAPPIKIATQESEQALIAVYPTQLVQKLITQVAYSNSQGPITSSVKQHFELALVAQQSQLYGMSDNALADAQQAVVDELRMLKAIISEFDTDAEEADTALEDISQQLMTLSSTLEMIGHTVGSQLLISQAQAVSTLSAEDEGNAAQVLRKLADSLVQLESNLMYQKDDSNSVETKALQQIIIQECLFELAILKEELTLAAQHQVPPELSARSVTILTRLMGSLDVLGQAEITRLMQATIEAIQTPPHDQGLSSNALEHLAEILSASELYMEAIAHHGQASSQLLSTAYSILSRFGEASVIQNDQPQSEAEIAALASEEILQLDDTGADEPHIIEVEEAPASLVNLEFDEPIIESQDAAESSVTEPVTSEPDALQFETHTEADLRYGEGIDRELADVFVEEAEEVLTELHQLVPRWSATPNPADLATIRRHIHTLKGSGRMAGASAIATLAMELENLLNEVLDGFNLADATLAEVLAPVVSVFAELVNRFVEGEPQLTAAAEQLQANLQNVHSDETLIDEAEPTDERSLSIEDPLDDTTSITTVIKPPDEVTSLLLDNALDIDAVESNDALQKRAEDEELMEIFLAEATQHLETLSQASQILRPNDVIDKKMLAAAHSLKGCANIAAVQPVALIATELDKSLRELHRQQHALQPDQLDLLTQITRDLDTLLEAIRIRADEPDIRILNQKIQTLRPLNTLEDTAAVLDPEQLVSFLEETDFLLDNYTRQLTQWQQSPTEPHRSALSETLTALAESADHVELKPLSDVYRTLQRLIDVTDDTTPEVEGLLDQGYEWLNLQIEALLQNKPAADYSHFIQQVDTLLSAPALQPTSVEQYIARKQVSASTGVTRYLEKLAAITPRPVEDTIVSADASSSSAELSVDPHFTEQTSADSPAPSPTSVDRYLAQLTHADFSEAEILATVPVINTDADEVLDITEDFPAHTAEKVDPELLEAFCEEAGELLSSSQQAMKQWQTTQDDDALMQLQRDLHTLKGGARLTGIDPIADLTHQIESLMLEISEANHPADERFFDLLQRSQDQLVAMQEQLAAQHQLEPADRLIAEIQRYTHQDKSDLAPPEPKKSTTLIPSNFIATSVNKFSPHIAPSPPVLNPTEQIRVRADLLDYLSNFAGEVSISRDRVTQQHQALRQQLSEMEETVGRLHEQLRKLEIETETQILYRFEDSAAAHIAEFDPLELDRFSTIQQLSRSLTESVIDMNEISQSMNELVRETDGILLQQSRLTTDLQQGLMDTRLLPFNHIVPRLERIVRQANIETGKQSQLIVEGSSQEIDRAILDRLVPPIEHLLRNAIAHGIEAPEQRQQHNKPVVGQLRMMLNREGSEIVLTLQDDGQGLDLEKIRHKALSLGLVTTDNMPEDEALIQLILSSGFSTADTVSQLAGRGVGMDVVNSEIRALKGRLFIESFPQHGAKFTIRLPLTFSLIQALLVTAHQQQFAIPLASVKAGERIAVGTISSLLSTAQPQYQFNGEKYDFVPLSHLLGEPLNLPNDARQPLPLLLYRSGGMRVALLVDAINSNREIVIKAVGQQLSHINALNGATILGDGRVVLILDIATLIEHYKTHSLGLAREMPTEQSLQKHNVPQHTPTAMIVDDSITMRKASGNLLLRLGFEVLTAKDGIEALAQLHDKQPDIILLDVEMPRMDGFEFASIVRNDSRFRHLPIIMITSRTGDKHRQRALGIGVNDYLGKPYQENELVAAMKHLLKTSYPQARH